MEIFWIGIGIGCFFVGLAIYVKTTRFELPPDSEVMPDKYLDDVPDAVKAAWESIKLKK